MRTLFGPWATAIHVGSRPQLAAFWKKRMAMLVSASRSRTRISRPTGLSLVAAAVFTCALPTFRASWASARNEAGLAKPSGTGPAEAVRSGNAQSTSSAPDVSRDIEDFLVRVETPRPPRKGRLKLHSRNPAGQICELRLKETELQNGDFVLIGQLNHLEVLDLSTTNTTDDDLRLLAGLRNLRELTMWDTGINGSGLVHLAVLDRLERLDLGDTKITDEPLRHLKALSNLRHLVLTRNNIGDSGLEQVAELRDLLSLKLGETNVTDEGLRHLKTLKNLRGLVLDETKVTQSGLDDLAASPAFRWISSPARAAEEFVRRIERGDHQAVEEMRSIGLVPPDLGEFQLLKLDAIPRTEADRRRARYRFHVEMRWTVEAAKLGIHSTVEGEKLNETFYADLSVDRGAVRVTQEGILPKNAVRPEKPASAPP